MLPIDDNPILDLLRRRIRVTERPSRPPWPSWSASGPTTTTAACCSRAGSGPGARWWPRPRSVAPCSQDLRQDGPFHIGVLLENTSEYLFLLAGAALVGAVIVGINPTRRGAELATDIRRPTASWSSPTRPNGPCWTGWTWDWRPTGCWWSTATPTAGRVRRQGHRTGRRPVRDAGADDLYLLIFTSGSTGGPKAVRMTQGRAARASAGMGFTPDDVLYSAMPLFHGNALSAAVLPAIAGGATLVLRRRFSASGFLPDIRDCRGHLLQHRRAGHLPHRGHPPHRARPRPPAALRPRARDLGPGQGGLHRAVRRPVHRGVRLERERHRPRAGPRRPARGPGPGPARDDVAVVDADTVEECPRAVFDDEGRLTNAAEAIGELVGRQAAVQLRGLLQQPRGRRRAHPQRLVLVGRPRLPRRRRGLLLRRPDQRLAPGGQRELRRRAGRAHPRPVPGVGRGGRLRRARQPHRRPGDGGPRARAGRRPSIPTPSPPSWPPRPTWAPSGRPATCGSSPPSRSPPPTRWTRGRCGPSMWNTADPVWHRVGRSADFVPMTAEDVAELDGRSWPTGGPTCWGPVAMTVGSRSTSMPRGTREHAESGQRPSFQK